MKRILVIFVISLIVMSLAAAFAVSAEGEGITFVDYVGRFSMKYSIPQSMYDSISKDENGAIDNSACFFTLSDGNDYPLTQWNQFINDEAGRHQGIDELTDNAVANVGTTPVNTHYVYEKDGQYFLQINFFGLAGCAAHGGWTDETVTQFKYTGTDGVTNAYEIVIPVEACWNDDLWEEYTPAPVEEVNTGDNSMVYLWGSIVAITACAFVVVESLRRKANAAA